MPYALPAQPSPPMPLREPHLRPPRHHSRSRSHDALPPSVGSPPRSSAGFIFVQPASPEPHAQQQPSAHDDAGVERPRPLARSPRTEGAQYGLAGPRAATASSKHLHTHHHHLPAVSHRHSSASPSGSGSDSASSSRNHASSSTSTSRDHAARGHERAAAAAAAQQRQRQTATSPPLSSPTAPHTRRASDPLASSSSSVEHAPKSPIIRKKSGELVRSSLKPSTPLSAPPQPEPALAPEPPPRNGDAQDDDDREGHEATLENGHRRQLRRPTFDSSASKVRSAPATPTCPKNVHFDTQLEHVKLFLAQQRPTAVSRSGSPIETETEDEPDAYPFPAMPDPQERRLAIKLPNFVDPKARDPASHVILESLVMAPDAKSVRGVVRVDNLAFEKWVAVRFTFDNWQTVSEVSGEYLESLSDKQDRFSFTIKLQDLYSSLENRVAFLAVRYTVGGREIWDNNDGDNYRVEFVRAQSEEPPKPQTRHQVRQKQVAAANSGNQSWSVTDAGMAADRMADLRRELDRLVAEDSESGLLRLKDHSRNKSADASDRGSRRRWRQTAADEDDDDDDDDGTRTTTSSSTVTPASGTSRSPLAHRYDFGAAYKQPSWRPASPQPPARGVPGPAFSAASGQYAPSSSSALFANSGPRSPTSGMSSWHFQPSAPSSFKYLYNSHAPQEAAQTGSETSEDTTSLMSPRQDQETASALYSSGSSDEESHRSQFAHHQRYYSFPPTRSPPSGILPGAAAQQHQQHQNLMRAYGMGEHSPFSSPLLSPDGSPASHSPAISPRGGNSPVATRSPSLVPPPSLSEVSPGGSTEGSYSPHSIPSSPATHDLAALPGGPKTDMNTFLDRYCFHTSSAPSSLGLVGTDPAPPSVNGSESYLSAAPSSMSCAAFFTSAGMPPSKVPAPAPPSPSATYHRGSPLVS